MGASRVLYLIEMCQENLLESGVPTHFCNILFRRQSSTPSQSSAGEKILALLPLANRQTLMYHLEADVHPDRIFR